LVSSNIVADQTLCVAVIEFPGFEILWMSFLVWRRDTGTFNIGKNTTDFENPMYSFMPNCPIIPI
jgi:hypothetical protein